MRLQIEHQTHYTFEEEAHHSIQYLRLTPRTDPNQVVYNWEIRTKGALTQWSDGFGNYCHTAIQSGKHEEVVITVRGEVETNDTAGVLPSEDEHWPLVFKRGTPYTAATADVCDFCIPFHDQLKKEGTLNTMHALMHAIANKVKYQTGYTTVCTTAGEALAQGKGVCQDHAHLFIACCRALGLPARYVSGYLFADEVVPALEAKGLDSADAKIRGATGSHAWAEVLIEDLGWVSFDPANNQSATDAYVRLAVGFDYESASPIRGLRTGGGAERMKVKLKVGPKRKREKKSGQYQRQS